jgi:hypothetical protein
MEVLVLLWLQVNYCHRICWWKEGIKNRMILKDHHWVTPRNLGWEFLLIETNLIPTFSLSTQFYRSHQLDWTKKATLIQRPLIIKPTVPL